MIIFTSVVLLYISIDGLVHTGPINDGFKAVNTDKMFDMIGFSFYAFEGIGTILPILKESQNPTHMPRLLTLTFAVLIIYFCAFAMVTYKYFGNQKEPIIINNINNPSDFIKIVKLLFCVNLMFSYPLSIFPTNTTIEAYTLSKLKDGPVKYWLANLSRLCVCLAACFTSIMFQLLIDEFLGFTGAILGIPIILIIPLVCHYILVAKSRFEKGLDVVLIVFSAIVAILCSYKTLLTFIDEFRKLKAKGEI